MYVPRHVELQRAAQLFDRGVGQVRRGERAARVAHHHVEAAAIHHHPGDDLVDLAFDRDVAAETGRVEPSGAELRRDSLASRRVPAGQIHRCAELGQGLGHRSAEVRPAPGHDRDAAGEVEEGLDSHAGDHSSTGWRPAEGDPPVR
jgi:hypothetical protein